MKKIYNSIFLAQNYFLQIYSPKKSPQNLKQGTWDHF